ncbi:hypothetical protein ABZT28_51420 [Streptomyces sp. NPDC005388]|uniref:hypothetical protein n=1 Tax=Streptomyces sp. NPDC005388 TaxID=3156717 RepID=UPI0033BE9309
MTTTPCGSKRANNGVDARISLHLGRHLALVDDGLGAVQGGSLQVARRFGAGARAAHRLTVRVKSDADLRVGVCCVPGGRREGAGFAEHRRQAQGRQHAEAAGAPGHTAGIGHGGRHLGWGDSAQ